jgi:lipoate-protein ligase A
MRLVILNNVEGIYYPAYEKMLFDLFRKGTIPETIWLSRFPKVIYICSGTSLDYLGLDYIKEKGYEITRTEMFKAPPTGGASISGNNIGFFQVGNFSSFNFTNFSEYLKFFYDYWNYCLKEFNLEFDLNKNDLIIKDTDRKIGSGVMVPDNDKFTSFNMFSETLPDVDLDKIFILPKEKFDGKTVKSASERITSLFTETNKLINDDVFIRRTIEYFSKFGNIEIEYDFSQEEKDYVNNIKDKYTTDEWIKYGRFEEKPDFE